jgi:hypothetical protein
MSKC